MVTTLLSGVLVAACSRGHQYELRGQVLAVDPVRGELTIKHEDIKGFMPGMTMPFKVSQPSVMTGIVAGDLVQATLLVEDSRGYLTAVTRTGTAPLTEAPPRPYVEPLAPGTEVPDVALLDDTGAPPGILPTGGAVRSPSHSSIHAARCRTSVRSWIGSSPARRSS